MGRISSSIGLITGTDIVGTVDKLLAISAQPRDRLVARTEKLQEQQSAIAELTALVIGVELSSKRLSLPGQFEARTATSTNDKAVSVAAASNAEMGSFTARTLQLAATHSAESDFRSTGSATSLGLSGEILIRSGGFLAESAELSKLNQGRGVQPGSIRISDRAGNSAQIDLSKAKNIDDVINAINETSSIRVRATTVGDSIRLTDISGSTTSNLRVDEVGGGETAADLGLRGINVSGNTALGHDIYGTVGDTVATGLQGIKLSELNGGAGLGTLGTIQVRTSNGNTGSIDLSAAATTQDVIRTINDSGLGVEARLNDNSGGFRIRDLTGGNANTLSITSTDSTASKLGINSTSTGRVIDGKDLGRPIINLNTKLAELRQGRGISPGSIRISDSTGKSANVALEDTQQLTINQLLTGINNSGLSLTASINA
ncbi:MAG TPA: flagellar hook protein FliD, partial [Planctomycetaceae bacterium]|nr:flagellar hook protein FliD [Planctomycetaceae bacterium]